MVLFCSDRELNILIRLGDSWLIGSTSLAAIKRRINMMLKQNNFNILRFIFASLVIVSHAPEIQDGSRKNELLTNMFGTISFGELAVDSFFILSGYLILKSWIENPNLVRFLKSRIFRIYPGFIVASLVCVFIVGPAYGESNYLSEFRILSFLKSIVTLQQPNTPPVFFGSHFPVVNGAMWTIYYEFTCYLLVLLLGLIGFYKQRYSLFILTLLLTGLFLLNKGSILELGKVQPYVRLGMIFLYGACFYFYREYIHWRFKFSTYSLCIVFVLLFSHSFAEVAIGIFWGYSVIYFANTQGKLLLFNKLPDVSYGIYLYAWPITKVIYQEWPNINVFLCMAITLFISILFGMVSWHVIEKPFIKLKSVRLTVFQIP